MHFDAADPAAAVAWYAKYLPAKLGSLPDRVVVGRTIFAFAKVDNPLPSAGSAIDHIGISVPNVDAKMKELEAAGAKVTMPRARSPVCRKPGSSRIPSASRSNFYRIRRRWGFIMSTCGCRIPTPN
jgi:predicted enzyme related to lactoylglutathione lyase